eukprot:757032-Hanusia_phi.AAC.1
MRSTSRSAGPGPSSLPLSPPRPATIVPRRPTRQLRTFPSSAWSSRGCGPKVAVTMSDTA